MKIFLLTEAKKFISVYDSLNWKLGFHDKKMFNTVMCGDLATLPEGV